MKGDTSFTLTTPEGTKEGIALGWEDVHDLREGTITRRATDDNHPSGPIKCQMVYHAPFDCAMDLRSRMASRLASPCVLTKAHKF